ncbi:MAG: elongation factor G [Oscillospiraceae bacterium]|nr:elongation factor G [Oscillospiraceae bacterium]
MITTKDIRNISLLGHGGDGKSALAESMLYLTKAIDRLGKAADGTTASDYDPEEIKRQFSISSTLLPVEYGGAKLNILDTPGFFDFVGEVFQSLRVSESGVIVLTAKSGIGVGTEKAWKYLSERKLPRFAYVSKIDEEHADYMAVLESMRSTFGITVVPVVIPVVDGGKVTGVFDLVTGKAYTTNGLKTEEIPLPDSMADTVAHCTDMLSECVAEASEELMDKYFGGEPFTPEEMVAGIKAGVLSMSMTPVFCGSAVTGMGTELLMRGLADYAPSPLDAADPEIPVDPDGPTAAFVFKSLSDQYGRFSFFKVMRGKVATDMTLLNTRSEGTEKLSHIYFARGKKNTEVPEIICGDIGCVSKLSDTKTNDTLCDPKAPVTLKATEYNRPCYSMAIAPKVKGQDEKISSGLTRMNEEDLTFTVVNNSETKQLVLSGAGDIHLAVLCSRLKSRFGVDVELSSPRIAYREKIRKKVKVQGRHKKQSGGHGQFGDVWIEFEPGEEEDLVFEEKIFGGAVPKNYFPAVEKGLRDCIQKGVLAGYPVVNLKATLVDGSYHPVDSSEMAFKTAASLAYKAGLPQASPVLLEPIGALKVTVPDNYTGDIMGDLNKRGGRVLGMNPGEGGQQIIEAEVPMGGMSTYAIDLRSMTQGRGSFEFDFVRYEEASPMTQQKVIEEYKASQQDD